VDWGKKSLATEADAITRAAEKLGDSFADGVKVLCQCDGKIATTGLGKSGHIAKKIAATFASTGSPSYFIHPSEALHGDFGMLSTGDCLLAIAFGGETPEVNEVVQFARRSGIPIVAITGK